MSALGRAFAITVIGLGFLFAPPAWPKKQKKTETDYLNPREIIKLAESSKVTYNIGMFSELEGPGIADLADTIWRTRASGPDFPWVDVSSDGSRTVTDYPLDPECVSALNEAEPLFDDEQYARVLEKYQAAAQKFPRCYVALSHLGDAYHFLGNTDQALVWYERSIELNPFDHRGWFYKANALVKLGRFAEARSAYTQSLALRPRNPTVMEVVKRHADALDIDPELEPFAPQALARREDDSIAIYLTEDGPSWWLVWGTCKALWIGEPGLRQQRGEAADDYDWSSTEDVDCLLAMLENYFSQSEQGKSAKDPTMERLLDIAKNGLLGEFVVYEFGSRIWPPMSLNLPDDQRAEVVRFVEAYILPRRQEPARDSVPEPPGISRSVAGP